MMLKMKMILAMSKMKMVGSMLKMKMKGMLMVDVKVKVMTFHIRWRRC